MTATELIPFHGDELLAVDNDVAHYIVIKPICERLGLAWAPQHRKLSSRPELWGITIMMIPSASGEQDTACLPVNRLAAWLFSINPGKVAGPFRDALIRYQIEAADALDAHFRAKRERQDEELAAYEDQARLAASTLLSAQPMWNKIARLQEAGVAREAIRHHINRSEAATDAVLDLMERSGAIDWTAWAGWNTAHRRHLRKSDFYARAIMRRNIEAGAYSPEMAAKIEAALAEPVEAR